MTYEKFPDEQRERDKAWMTEEESTTETPRRHVSPLDAWELEEPGLINSSLPRVLREKETLHDKREPYTQIGFRKVPNGTLTWYRDIAQIHECTYSQLTRLAQKLGTIKIQADSRMVDLIELEKQVRSAAMDSGSPSALARLDLVQPYDYVRGANRRSTFSCIWWVNGGLSMLANVCGIDKSNLAIVAVLTAMLTLPNERGYRQHVTAEVDHFWEFVERRRQILLLG